MTAPRVPGGGVSESLLLLMDWVFTAYSTFAYLPYGVLVQEKSPLETTFFIHEGKSTVPPLTQNTSYLTPIKHSEYLLRSNQFHPDIETCAKRIYRSYALLEEEFI